jgi:hypothetical protein
VVKPARQWGTSNRPAHLALASEADFIAEHYDSAAEFITGQGIFAIAEGLTRDSIPSPSAHDPERNTHRSGIAWAKGAVRAILTKPPVHRLPGVEQAAC